MRSGYLDPLKARVKAGGGKVYPDGPPLVLEAAAGQVQVQPPRADLLGVGGDEAKPDLRAVTR